VRPSRRAPPRRLDPHRRPPQTLSQRTLARRADTVRRASRELPASMFSADGARPARARRRAPQNLDAHRATIAHMYAQCPECLTIYALDTATLAQAQGNVGCGQCGATFNALATLVEALPEEDFEILPVHPNSPAPPILMMAVVHDAPPQHPLFEDASTRADEADA